MADYLPQNNGNWSTTTWITAFSNLTAFAGGNLPPASIDDVYTDGKSITIDTNIFVNSLRTTTSPRTGGLAGGGFFINNNISLTANALAGTTTCLTFLSASPNTCTIIGNLSSSTTASAMINNSSGTVNLFGDIISLGTTTFTNNGRLNMVGNVRGNINSGASPTNAPALSIATTGTVNLTGSTIGASFGNNTPGTTNAGVFNIIGNVLAGTGSVGGAWGLSNLATGVATVSGLVRGSQATGSFTSMFGIGNAGTLNVVGTVQGGLIGDGYGISNTGTNTVSVTGTVIGGTGSNAFGINNNTTGTVFVSGTVIGGPGASNNGGIGVHNNSSGTVTIVGVVSGNLTGGSANSYGANNGGTGTINISGDVFSTISAGAFNSATGTINIFGTVRAGTTTGAVNNSTGILYITRVIGNGFGLGSTGIAAGAVGASNTQNGRLYVEQVEFGSRGFTPISGPVYILPSNRNTLTGYTTAVGTPVTFYNSLSVSNLLPPTSSVRLGTVYNVGNSTGTMAVPSASAVQFGVAVDNTVGTAALQPQDVWGYSRLSATQVDSMGDRLRNTATTQSIGYQIASFNL